LDLGAGSHVGSTTFQYFVNDTVFGYGIVGLYWEIGANDGSIAYSAASTFAPVASNQWITHTIGFDVPNMRYVRVQIALNAPMANDAIMRMDNLSVGA